MFHPFVIYGILCDTCRKVFRDPDLTGLEPLLEPKLDDFQHKLLEKHGWRVLGDVTLCPEHTNNPPAHTVNTEARLREDNRRLRAENRRLWEQLSSQIDKKEP